MNLEPFGETRKERGRAVNDAHSTTLVFDEHSGDIFDLDVVCEGAALGLNRLDATHDPLNHVDVMDPLVDQTTATIKCPRATPISRIVIRLGSIPLDVSVSSEELPQVTTSGDFAESSNRSCKTVLTDRGQLDSSGSTGVHKSSCGFHRNVDWLFDHHVLSGFRASDSNLGMQAAWDADANRIDGIQKALKARVRRNGVFCRESLGPLGLHIKAPEKRNALNMLKRLGVGRTDCATPDNSESNYEDTLARIDFRAFVATPNNSGPEKPPSGPAA